MGVFYFPVGKSPSEILDQYHTRFPSTYELWGLTSAVNTAAAGQRLNFPIIILTAFSHLESLLLPVSLRYNKLLWSDDPLFIKIKAEILLHFELSDPFLKLVPSFQTNSFYSVETKGVARSK